MLETVWEYLDKHTDALVAIAGVSSSLVALVAIIMSAYALTIQRRHNKLSVRPIADIGYADFENEISVWIRNAGIGPMTIDSISVRCLETDFVTSTLIQQMEKKGVTGNWTTFAGNISGRTLRAEGVMHLLKLEGDQLDQNFVNQRDATRRALLSVELSVGYSDVYGDKIGTESRELCWFGRHFFPYDFETRRLLEG